MPTLSSQMSTVDYVLTTLQRHAIAIGLADGSRARLRSPLTGFVQLFASRSANPLANDGLEAIRAYAELRSALHPRDTMVPTASLAAQGYSSAQQAAIATCVSSRLEHDTKDD